MTATMLEISAHVIGGPEVYPRHWGPTAFDVPTDPGAWCSVMLDCASTASLWLRVDFRDWSDLGGGWLGATAELSDVNMCPLGRRPALVYDRPYDVATVTSFYVPREQMVFQLLTRKRT